MEYLDVDLKQLVKDFEVKLKNIKRDDFNSEQLYINECNDLLEIYRTKISSCVLKFVGKENYDEAIKDYYSYGSQLQLILENHIENLK